MTNIITQVRKALVPIKTTGRALGIFSKALDALDEVRSHQAQRIAANDIELDHNHRIIDGLRDKNAELHDDTANALLEVSAAESAAASIRALLPK